MRKLSLLIKNYFNCFIGRFNKNKNKKRLFTGASLILLIGAIFVIMFINLAIGTVSQAKEAKAPEMALYVFAAMALVFVLILIISKSSSQAKSKDEEMLLSLPFKKSEIIGAKVFYDYLFDFVIVFITIVPSYIVYAVMTKSSFIIPLRSVIISILIPMLSSAIGYFISLLFSLVARKFKHYSIVQSILSIFLLMIFLVVYYGINLITSEGKNEVADAVFNFAPIKWIVYYIYQGNLLSLFYISICAILPFIVSILIKTNLLGKTFNNYKSNNKEIRCKKSSPLKSLFKREIARYFSISSYVVNTAFGGIILIVVGAILCFIGKDYFLNLLATSGYANLAKYINIAILAVIIFSTSTICLTSASISLEGKTLWILKAHPVKAKDVFLSKILVNVVVCAVPIIICASLSVKSLGLEYLPFLILIPIVFAFSLSNVGLLINLMYPKFDWETEIYAVKQSMSVGLALAINMIIGIIPLACYFILIPYMEEMLVFLIIFIIYLLITLVTYRILIKKGTHLFLELNN